MTDRPIRLGAVSYLNARPLTWSLDDDPRWRIRYDLPSACAGVLARGEVDLALVSSVEYLRSVDYRLVPRVGIGSRGAVASIGLFTRKPVQDVRSIALDTSSLTSVALVRILCERQFGIAPAFVSHAPDLAAMTAALRQWAALGFTEYVECLRIVAPLGRLSDGAARIAAARCRARSTALQTKFRAHR